MMSNITNRISNDMMLRFRFVTRCMPAAIGADLKVECEKGI